MDKRKMKKLLILNLPYFLVGLFATNLGEAWRLAEGADSSAKILSFFHALPIALNNPFPSFHPLDLLIGILCGAGLRLAVYLKGKNAKKYRHNVEYGSARWGTAKDIEPFIAPKFEDNVILTKTERLMMSNRPKNPANARNKNVLIIGGSGSGKTRFWLKPNLLQMHSSYVVTDPKGSIVIECGNALLKHGYTIKIFNTINFQKSMHYNPFAYIHSEKDILKLVTTLIANTKGDGKAGDEFWTKAETLLYCALIGYIHYEAPVEEQNFSTLIEFLNAMEVREDDEEFQNPVDLMFEALEKKKPNHFAVRQYKKYKLAAGKTAKSILISCGARLAPFDIQEVRDVTAYDELQLDTLGDKKTALFLIMSDTDATFNFLISMIYTQLFNLLCEKADDVYGGRLPVHVRCLIDEMANIGQIPNLEKLVATIRSREISACLVLQAQSQLKAIYKDNADTIIGNMDSRIFLGGSEPTTLKELNQALGKETIDTYNTSNTRGNSPSYGLNYQKLGKDLASVDELAVLDGSKCILQLRGVRPFLSDKYDLTQHPNYKYTSDFDKRNEFKATGKAAQGAKNITERVTEFCTTHSKTILFVLIAGLLFMILSGMFSSCSAMFQGGTQIILGTSFTAKEEDIIGADNDYKALEAALRNKINNIERTHSGYDEYRYDLDEINHNPYELAAYLTVKFEDYTRDEVQATLQWLFEQQYELTLTEVVEIRTRTTSSTDPETGETTTEEEDYEYYILNVKLRNKGLNSVISNSGLSEDDMERYRILLQTRGNRPDIFGNDIYATPGGEYTDYDIPGEALTDTRFANMIREAEKYLGYPYVWGGSSPSTSFDCSGFVSYVINHCGNGWSVGRLTANGLMGVCDIIPKSSAKPGDLIFFQGTYDTSGASHVGIYVGNGMMIHCGNPISYASIESNYWQQHFYCFGRIRN